MRIRSLARWVRATMLPVVLAACASPAPGFYKIVDLGYLPGGSGYSDGRGINEAGDVVGTSDVGGQRAFVWSASGGMRDIGLPQGAHAAFGHAINNRGEVTGRSVTATGENRAFLYRPAGGTMTDIGAAAWDSEGHAINTDTGDIVGRTYLLDLGVLKFAPRPFAWSAATQKLDDLDLLPNQSKGVAYGINDHGQIVGVSEDATGLPGAVTWRRGQIVQLPTLAGSPGWGIAAAINNNGDIVGVSKTAGSWTHAVLWDPSLGMTDLGVLPGNFASSAYAVNLNRQVVGTSGGRAFIWDPGAGMRDLNDLVDARDPLKGKVQLFEATAINTRGQIVANGRPSPSMFIQVRAYLLCPNGVVCP